MGLGLAPFAERPAGPVAFPWPGAAIEINFLLRRYWWGGAEKLEANFTTFNLNGSTFDANGLTPSTTVDITLSLSGLGTYAPGSWGMAFYTLGFPASNSSYFQMDDGTSANRVVAVQLASTSRLAAQVLQATATQGNQTPAGTETTGVRHGGAHSYTTNNILCSADGVIAAPDVTAVMPTMTILRIGKATGTGATNGIISRIVIFTTAQADQAAVTALSIAMRDSA